ncbi:MAG: hypothetical protein ISR91_01545 [Candidatus Delongbacteria bacterium]|nr:hypothetical protein [Candidatus Delongbacteria bacterium]
MRRGLISTAILSLLLLQACYYGHRESNTQQPDECYLMFIGNLTEATVSVDQQEFVPLLGKLDDPRAAHYKYRIKPGNHMIIVKRHGNLILEKKIYVGPGESREIRIP